MQVEFHANTGTAYGGLVRETVDLCDACSLVFGDVEENAGVVIADEADTLEGVTGVAFGEMCGLFYTKASSYGTDGEGGD